MRQSGAVVLAILGCLLIVTVTSTAQAPSKSHAGCAPDHVHILLANAQSELYSRFQTVETYYERTMVYGCAKGHRRYELGEAASCAGGGGGGASCGGIALEQLTGPIVAFTKTDIVGTGQGSLSLGSASWLIVVRNLRTGRVLQNVPTGTRAMSLEGDTGIGRALAIVVKSDGAVAWIAEDDEQSAGGPTVYQVHALDKTGSRLLASGSDIRPNSLRLVDSTLSWRQGGKPMSAVLH